MARKNMVDVYRKMNIKEMSVKDLRKIATTLYRASSVRITHLQKHGLNAIHRDDLYHIDRKTGRMYQLEKGRDNDYYRRKIKEYKNFLNSPSNDLKKARKEQKRLGFSANEYQDYRRYSGWMWSELHRIEDYHNLGSDEIEKMVVDSFKDFKNPREMLKELRRTIDQKEETQKKENEILARKMSYLNSGAKEVDMDKFMADLKKSNPELF